MFNLYSWRSEAFPFLLFSKDKCAENGVEQLSCKNDGVWEHSGLGSKDLEGLSLKFLLPSQFIGEPNET